MYSKILKTMQVSILVFVLLSVYLPEIALGKPADQNEENRLTVIARASHIVEGIILQDKSDLAGGLVPVTDIPLLIKNVLKDSDGSLASGDTIHILVRGSMTNAGLIKTSDDEPMFFRNEKKVVFCLSKYYNHFRLFPREEFSAMAFINDKEEINDFDEESIQDTNSVDKQKQFIAWQNYRWSKNHEEWEIEIDQKLLESGAVDTAKSKKSRKVGDYKNAMRVWAIKSFLECGRKASIIQYVQVLGIIPLTGEREGYSEILFGVLKTIKGDGEQGQVALSFPDETGMKNFGLKSLRPGDEGLLLLENKSKVQSSPQYFIPVQKNGQINLHGEKTDMNQFINDLENGR